MWCFQLQQTYKKNYDILNLGFYLLVFLDGFKNFNVCEIWTTICDDFDDKAQNLFAFFY